MNTHRLSNLVLLCLCLCLSVGCKPSVPILTLTPERLEFGTQSNEQSLVVKNTGAAGTVLEFSASASVNWLSLEPASGQCEAGSPGVVLRAVLDRSVLPAVGGSTLITVVSNGGNKTISVTVAVTAEAVPKLSIAPVRLDFGADEVLKTLSIGNAASTGPPLSFSLSASEPWLSTSPASGECQAGAPATAVVIALDRTLLPAGGGSALIEAASNGGSVSIPVTASASALSVLPRLSVYPDRLDFDIQDSPLTLSIRNDGAAESILTFTATPSAAWLSATPASGACPADGTYVYIEIALDRALMNGAEPNATVEITSNGGAKSIPIAAAPSPTLQVSTTSLDFGRSSEIKTFVVSNAGPAGSALQYRIECDAPWLYLLNTPESGTITTLPLTVQLMLLRNEMTKATYETTLRLLSNGGDADVMITAEPELYVGRACKGYIVDAEVYKGDALLTRTASAPDALGCFDVPVDQADRGDIIKIQGGPDSRDTLDGTLDADDPSFEGRYLEVVLSSEKGAVFANPITTLQAARYRHVVANGALAGVATYFTERVALEKSLNTGTFIEHDYYDMMQPGFESMRLHHERIWAACELCMAAGNELEACLDALAFRLDGTPGRGENAALLEALVNFTPLGARLFPLQLELAALLDHLIPTLPQDAPVTHEVIAAAQRRLRTALDELAADGVFLDKHTGATVLASLNQDTPTADAGADQPYAKTDRPVLLDGSASSDPNQRELTYFWSRADEYAPLLDNSAVVQPAFTPTAPGVHTYHLWVFNGLEWSAVDSVTVTVSVNAPPVADAGPDLNAPLNRLIFVSASGSTDPNGDPLQFSWTLTSAPDAAESELISPDSGVVGFRASSEGVYELLLRVSDGFGGESTDTVQVTVDLDGDGMPSSLDDDRDGDGIPNDQDVFPDDPLEWIDSLGDGIGNLARLDEDNDVVPDDEDWHPFDPERSALLAIEEFSAGDTFENAQEIAVAAPCKIVGELDDVSTMHHFALSSETSVPLTILALWEGRKVVLGLLDGNGEAVESLPVHVNASVGVHAAAAWVMQPGAPLILTVQAPPDGVYDASSYALLLVQDGDRDGLDDDMETALGMNPYEADIDGDGVFDAAEVGFYLRDEQGRRLYGSDVDGDGMPNWLDADSDGDWIPDHFEGAHDPDGDGLPSFVDLDADGNDILDQEEAGPFPTWPLDSDLDDLPDFRDMDDDGDGILDVNDAERLIPVAYADGANETHPRIAEAYAEWEGRIMPAAAYEDGVLRIVGSGFLWGDVLVIFEGSDQPMNVSPETVSPDLILVRVPESAGGRVSVVSGGVKSNSVDIRVLKPGQPGLYLPDAPTDGFVQPGDEIVLYGQFLLQAPPAEVRFEGASAMPIAVGDTWLRVVIPAGAVTGKLCVVAASGESNALDIEVGRLLTGQVILPSGAPFGPSALLLVPDGIRETRPDGAGQFQLSLDASGPVTLDALIETDGDGLLSGLQTVVLPEDVEVPMNAWTTASALVFNGIAAAEQAGVEALPAVRDLLDGLPEVQALGAIIADGLAENAAFMNEPSAAFFEQSVAAYHAAQSALAAAGFKSRRCVGDGVFNEKGLATIITPDELFGVEIVVNDQTGNVSLLNDTKFYVSAEIRQMGSGGVRVLQPHVRSYFDKDMVGPQGWGILHVSNQHDYGQPKGRDCVVEVVSPGFDGVSEIERGVRFNLRLRTGVDQFLVPILSPLIGKRVEGKALAEILLSVAPGAVNDFAARLDAGDGKGAFRSLFEKVLVDAEVRKKLLNALGKKLGYGMGEEFAKRVAEKVSARLVPVVGQIKTAMDVLETADLVGGLSGLLLDLSLTPPAFVFNVEFGFTLDEVNPPVFVIAPRPQRWTIRGRGFGPTPAGWISAEKRPRVQISAHVYDADGSFQMEEYDAAIQSINADGTEITVEASAGFSGRVRWMSPIIFKITHNEHTVQSDPIVAGYIEYFSFTPDQGSSTTPVLVRGRGFKNGSPFMRFISYTADEQQEECSFGTSSVQNGRMQVLSDSELLVYPPDYVESCWVQLGTSHTYHNYHSFYYAETSLPFYVTRWTMRLFGASYARGEDSFGKVLGELRLNNSLMNVLTGDLEHGFWSDGWNFLGYYGSAGGYHQLPAGVHSCSMRNTYTPNWSLTLSTSHRYGQPYEQNISPSEISNADLGATLSGTFTVGDNPAYVHPQRQQTATHRKKSIR